METKLYISDEAIEKYGYAHFRGVEYDDYKSIACDEFIELEDGLLVNRDDMYNIYISVNEDDVTFSDIEDLRNEIELSYNTQFFNMTAVCKLAEVNYSTFKGWKNNGFGMSEKKIVQILKTMKEISNDIEIKED